MNFIFYFDSLFRIPTPDQNFVRLLGLFAATTGTIAFNLKQIPNQPTVFLVDINNNK